MSTKSDSTPLNELGLPDNITSLLVERGVKNYGELCCVTLGDLKKWGLESEDVEKVIAMAK